MVLAEAFSQADAQRKRAEIKAYAEVSILFAKMRRMIGVFT